MKTSAFVRSCEHCGSPRLTGTLAEFLAAQMRDPLPGFELALLDFAELYEPSEPMSMCTGCFCFCALVAHSH